MITGFFNGVLINVLTSVVVSNLFGLLFGLVFGAVFWLGFEVFLVYDTSIKPVEIVVWSWRSFWGGLITCFGVGLVVGGIITLFVGWYYSYYFNDFLYYFFYYYHISSFNLSQVWPGILCLVVIITFAGGLFGALSQKMIDEREIEVPNQGIWRSFRNGVLMGLIFGVVYGLAATLFFNFFYPGSSWSPERLMSMAERFFIPFGVPFGLLAGLRSGGAPSLQHFFLRLFLWRTGSLPWNYPHFLDYAAERILLRKAGGGYIFVHRLLLDYFVALGTSSPEEHQWDQPRFRS